MDGCTYNDQLKERKKVLEAQTGLGSQSKTKKKTAVADPKTYEELSANIEIYKKKLTGADTEEQRIIRKKILRWEEALEAIENLQKQSDRPSTLTTLEDIDKEISHQRTLRSKATVENIAEIDTEIKRLEALRTEIEQGAHVALPIEEIKSYNQLNAEISYYTDMLRRGGAEMRAFAQANINALTDVKDEWDSVLAGIRKPGDISTLTSIEKLDEAVSYYQEKQRKASAEEVLSIQKVIDELLRKRKVMQLGMELPSMTREADEINKLTGRDYKLRIQGMGFEELTAKIKELQKTLSDMDNPVTEGQRKEIEGLIATYGKWRRESVSAFDVVRDGYGDIKSIGSGVESLTEALESDGNTWRKLTSIIDGFLQIYDGVRSVVSVVNTLSAATQAQTGATAAHVATQEADTLATEANTQAALVNTSAKSGEAVANATASGAKLPFPANLAAIAAAVAAVVGALSIIGSFATGGIVGGNSPTGDKLLARVNSGEMILNKEQQTRLFAMLEGRAAPPSAPGAAGITPFANGGVISGPTIGLIGEYAGAVNNPEVVAPLDRIRGLIQPSDGIGGKVVFKISGRELRGILEKEYNLKSRT